MRKRDKKLRIIIAIVVAVVLCGGMIVPAILSVLGESALSDSDVLPPELDYFNIRVVDKATGRGVPLVQLRTTNSTVYYTDSNGNIAYYEPGLMDNDVFFYISAHGYQFNENTFGIVGKTLKAVPGGEYVLEVERINIAERLYRVTGQGIYSDTVDLGLEAPIDNPVINSEVMAQDAAYAVEYKGSIFWIFNDTLITDDSGDSFRITGATSKLPSDGGLDPKDGVNLEYITEDNGIAKSIFKKVDGDPENASLSGLMVVKDKDNKDRLVAFYQLSNSKGTVIERGVTVYDDENQVFDERFMLETEEDSVIVDAWNSPFGKTTKYTDKGKNYYLITKSDPYVWPVVRVPATLDAVTDLSQYESYSPYKQGITKSDATQLNRKLSGAKTDGETIKGASWLKDFLELDSSGNPVYSWKKDTEPMTAVNEKKLISHGVVDEKDALFQIKDNNRELKLKEVSISYNEYRDAWVMIALQLNGTSPSGEVWFAEAKSPVGPWSTPKKVVTHDQYSFINLSQYGFFNEDGGKAIYFDGTYTADFSPNKDGLRTPKYDYNRIMYRLDLTDERLGLE